MTDIERKRHLVIVDDEPVILQVLTAVFEDGPWEVTPCANGLSAKEVMHRRGVDILLTDKNLPDINGLELMAEAKAINPLAEAILITAYASLESAISALELDAFDYVLKPLNNVFEIRKKVERAADKQRIAEENVALMRDLELVSSDEPVTKLLCQGMVLAEAYYHDSTEQGRVWVRPDEVEIQKDAKGKTTDAERATDGAALTPTGWTTISV